MYKPDIEAMPRDIKEELVTVVLPEDFVIDDLISLEDKKKSRFDFREIINALTGIILPEYWIVSKKSSKPTDDYFYIVFEQKLSTIQEEMFLEAMENLPYKDTYIIDGPLSEKYGIY